MNIDQHTLSATSQNDQCWLTRVTLKNEEPKRYSRPRLAPPRRPIVAPPLLRGRQISFRKFLLDKKCAPYLALLFGERGTAAKKMITEFRAAKDFYYFGYRSPRPSHRPPGFFDETNAASKRALMEFARLAYRWDCERRGQAFWTRIAWLLWNSYESLMALRRQAAKIKRQEIARISKLGEQRRKGAARVQRHRAKIKAERLKQAERRQATTSN